MSGIVSYHKQIASIALQPECEITTTEEHGYTTGNFCRITGLGIQGGSNYGCEQLLDNRYKIVVTGTTTFKIKDPIKDTYIDSSSFTSYVSGGLVNQINQNFVYES